LLCSNSISLLSLRCTVLCSALLGFALLLRYPLSSPPLYLTSPFFFLPIEHFTCSWTRKYARELTVNS
jgi:hypothetical protein